MILSGLLLRRPDAAPRRGWLRLERDRIAAIGDGSPPASPDLGDAACVISPGFTDAHLHLPQIDHRGLERPDLFSWLRDVIFPAEARWADPAVARAQVARAHAALIDSGTLGYAAFLSVHAHGADAVRAVHRALPLRAQAGVSLMDCGAPDALLDPDPAPPPPAAPRLSFSVNPRFALSCTPALLGRAGSWAGPERLVHTHLAEQRDECRQVRDRFPDARHYTDVYDRAGLLGPRTLLAHGIHLAPEEWSMLAARGATIVHCPGANTFLDSGMFDLAAAQRSGVRVALGSDVAAGPDLAMPRVARAMIEIAKLRRMSVDPQAVVPTPADAWTMITRTSAEAIGHVDGGRLEVGACADLLVLRVPFPADENLVTRLLYTWQNDYIVERILAGRPVGDAARTLESRFPMPD